MFSEKFFVQPNLPKSEPVPVEIFAHDTVNRDVLDYLETLRYDDAQAYCLANKMDLIRLDNH